METGKEIFREGRSESERVRGDRRRVTEKSPTFSAMSLLLLVFTG